MDLISQSRDHARIGSQLANLPGLPNVMRQRFLSKYIFAALHGFHRGDKMCVIGGIHTHRIDLIAHFIEHYAKIRESGRLFDLWVFFRVLKK